ncbi:putative endo-1,3(4)-beta-glucanase [Cladobotryum mycophilum]|uniref:Endo-1,3(4)-beta-glucanase n=1 Tax=Cladobotryum mycophilum TaxID=491253 RepID=A0ABR0T2I1_9HYPO
MAYSLINSYAGEGLLSGFNWYNGVDPTFGFVAYQSQDNAQSMGLYSVDEGTGVVRLGVDHTNKYALDQGRPSIRLESKESYNQGLFIADFLHMPPSKCGLWPAFWAYGGDWPNNGEVDIIEGVNTNTKNIISAHTRFGCTQAPPPPLSRFSGQQRNAECAAGGDNVGCGFDPPSSDASTYGDGFNAAQGGVYAMQWDSETISLWHFPRGAIPSDIEEKKPNPENWGMPQAAFGGPSCDVDSFWKNMNIVINIDFCGAWGGSAWGKSDSCNELAPTCAEYVAENPEAFADAYWDVRYIDAYQLNGLPNVEPTTAVRSSTAEPIPAGSTAIKSLAIESTTTEPTIVEPTIATSNSVEPTTTTYMTSFATKTVTIGRAEPTSQAEVSSQEQSTRSIESSIGATIIPYSSTTASADHIASLPFFTPYIKAYNASSSVSNATYMTHAAHANSSSATSTTQSSTQWIANSTTEGFATIFVARPTKINHKANSTTSTLSTLRIPFSTGPARPTKISHGANSTMSTFHTSHIPLSTGPAFKTFLKPISEPTTNPSKIGDFSYLGCFESDSSFRSFEKVGESKNMTAEHCIKLCKDRTYAGVFDTQCFCADDLDEDTTAAASKGTCGRSCPGDKTQFCGGVVEHRGIRLHGNSTAPAHGTAASSGRMSHTTHYSNSSTSVTGTTTQSSHALSSGGASASGHASHSSNTMQSNQTTHLSHTSHSDSTARSSYTTHSGQTTNSSHTTESSQASSSDHTTKSEQTTHSSGSTQATHTSQSSHTTLSSHTTASSTMPHETKEKHAAAFITSSAVPSGHIDKQYNATVYRLSNRFLHIRRANQATFALSVYRSNSKQPAQVLKFKTPSILDTTSVMPSATSTDSNTHIDKHSNTQSNTQISTQSNNTQSNHVHHVPTHTYPGSNSTFAPFKWNATTFATEYATATDAVTSIHYITLIPIPAAKYFKEVTAILTTIITEHCGCTENTSVTRTKTLVVTTTQTCDETVPTTEVKIVEPVLSMTYAPLIPSKEPVAIPFEEPVVAPYEEPVVAPYEEPIAVPYEEPIAVPYDAPIAVPTEKPVILPSEILVPTEEPVVSSEGPVAVPSEALIAVPSEAPIAVPAEEPVIMPAKVSVPSKEPVAVPSEEPAIAPSNMPSVPTPLPYIQYDLPSTFSSILSPSMSPSTPQPSSEAPPPQPPASPQTPAQPPSRVGPLPSQVLTAGASRGFGEVKKSAALGLAALTILFTMI